jgi:hypothetical protein
MVNVKYTVIKLNLYFIVHSNVWKFEKIWLSGILITIRKPKVWRTDGHEVLPFWCVFYARQAIKTAACDLVLHGIVSQSKRPSIINGVHFYDCCSNINCRLSRSKDECKYLFQLKNKACRFHSFIRMSMSCLLHRILQRHVRCSKYTLN